VEASEDSLPRTWFVAVCLLLSACFGSKDGKKLRLATTTSVTDSGLLAELAPAFEKRTGYHLEVSAVGSGKALELISSNGADVAITHAPDAEQQAIAAGRVGRRVPLMHNEFVLLGPKDGGQIVAGAADVGEALRKIAGSGRRFVSRADGSGTHQRETALWASAGVAADSKFIVEAHAGMGKTLELASKEGAFTLSDRGTFAAHRSDLELAIVFQGDPALRNSYSIIEPTAANARSLEGARALEEYLRSPEGKALLGGFGVKTAGEALFTPDN
jgi:tungstate transport system substrate-binding protein